MGKKGTKRKTKWRALPLGEEAGGSGNEEDLHDEDQSTTSSTAGGQFASNVFKRQPFYYKMADKPYRQTRRFTYERFRGKEPLVKLESKTFDEEEYTKITTPRQDVLFKKGYFGRKRESSIEESTPLTGETDCEEPLMDQIIITNGFVDERGHYLVNGNSYEIYDPYSNTVTVVVGPPPYANGVTHPVLAAVSCHPVPLQPVDWYPPGADWPSQGSAWTPSYPRNPPDSLNSPDCPPNFPSPDAQPPTPYDHPPFLVPTYLYNESPVYNGVPLQTNPPNDAQNAEEDGPEEKKTLKNSTEPVPEEEPKQSNEEAEETAGIVAQEEPETSPTPLPPSPQHQQSCSPTEQIEVPPAEQRPKVEKQSHSTQTNLLEDAAPPKVSGKKSHSTQTPSEHIFHSIDAEAQPKSNKTPSDIPLPPAKPEGETKPAWRPRYNSSMKKFREESPKIYQQRTNFAEERKVTAEKVSCSPVKVSYAKKTMSGLENASLKMTNGRVANGGLKSPVPVTNDVQGSVGANGTNRPKQGCEEKRNGFVKPRYSRGRTTNERSWQKYKKAEANGSDEAESKCEETVSESRSQSEKSSTVSELSSPAELSSGQNTPPEKLIVQKMEQEINKSFEVKLKQNLTKTENAEKQSEEEKVDESKAEEERMEEEKLEEEKAEEDKVEEEKAEEKSPGKSKGKKKRNKGKAEVNQAKESAKGGKRRRKKGEGKEKPEVEESSEDMSFLSDIRERELFFGWEGMKEEGKELMSEMGSFLNGDEEVLKFLGLDGRVGYSKLPLHSDLLMILPTIGWSRPKLKIEDFFAPTAYNSDLFTKRNITNMKSTKPEEFFASVVDSPVAEKSEKKKETGKKTGKPEETFPPPSKKSGSRTGCKKAAIGNESEEKTEEAVAQEGKLGIVEAVNTWLQEQGDSETVLSVDNLSSLMKEEGEEEEEDEEEEEEEGEGEGGGEEEEEQEVKSEKKNGVSNPMHALSAEGGGASKGGGNGCIRVANVVSDGFVHVRGEFGGRGGNEGRMYRSSSWDAMLSEVKIKKHFKFLTDSASFCQDLISDVRNGLPVGNEYATEELCDPKQMVRKYYTLAPSGAGRLRNESDSENEVFDALEYKFLAKEKQDAVANGKASITDSGVHSDVELSEDASTDQQKEKTCKLQ